MRAPPPGSGLRRAVAAIAIGVVLHCAGCGGDTPAPKRIILISMDTVRADRVSNRRNAGTTPRLAAIASEGTRFQRFYAASSYTIPSHMSLFTGLDSAEHLILRDDARLAPDVPTLASLLSQAGFLTQAFHEGGYVAPRFGFDRGFRSYVEVPRIGLVTTHLPQVLDWLRARDDSAYFLFLHTYAAHYPYGGYERHRAEHRERGFPTTAEITRVGRAGTPPWPTALCLLINQFAEERHDLLSCGNRLPRTFPSSDHFEQDRAGLLRSYDDRIGRIDAAIGAIEDLLREQGRWDDTLLVVTSDHGEAFFENQGFSQHGYVPFESVLHVPLVISFPRLLRENGVHVVDELAWHLDLLPTILSLANVAPPEGLAGRDLVPLLRGTQSPNSDRAVFPLVVGLPNQRQYPFARVTLQGPLKWIGGHEQFGDTNGLLFDLASDPGEQRNLRSERRDDAAALASLAREWESRLRARGPVLLERDGAQRAKSNALPPTEQEKLRALGYAD